MAAWDIRVQLLRRLSRITFREHRRLASGDAFVRIEQDVDQIAETGGALLLQAIPFALMTVTTVCSLVWIAPWLAGLILPLQLLLSLARRSIAKRLRLLNVEVQTGASLTGKLLQEFLPAIPQLQLLGSAEKEARLVVASLTSRLRAEVARRRVELRLGLLAAVAFVATTVLTFGIGGILVFRDRLTAGSLVASYGLLLRLADPFSVVIDMMTRVTRVSVSLERIMVLLNLHQEVRGTHSVSQGQCDTSCVEFADVHFSYEPGRQVFNGLNLFVAAGEKVAIIGESGIGKTTLGRLLTRMEVADSGQITFRGISIADYSLKDLRSQIFFLPQEPLLLDRSFRENITIGSDACMPDEELWQMLVAIGLSQTVRQHSRGLDTIIGPGGVLLSGGERQRLVLARCLVRRPELIILDESTSALDSVTESGAIENLLAAFPKQTFLFITHKTAFHKWANRTINLASDVENETAEAGHGSVIATSPMPTLHN